MNKIKILIIEDAREDRQRFRQLLESQNFRQLSESQNLGEQKEQFKFFSFAWAWPKPEKDTPPPHTHNRSVKPSVAEWLRHQIGTFSDDSNLWHILGSPWAENREVGWLSDYSLLLLDLAWSKEAEIVMSLMQSLPPGTGSKMASIAKPVMDEMQSLSEPADSKTTIEKSSLSEGKERDREEEYRKRLEAMFNYVEGIQFLEWWQTLSSPKPKIWVTSAYTASEAKEIRNFLSERYHQLPIIHKWNDEEQFVSRLELWLREQKQVRGGGKE